MLEVYQILPLEDKIASSVFTEVTFQWEIKNRANNFGVFFIFPLVGSDEKQNADRG